MKNIHGLMGPTRVAGALLVAFLLSSCSGEEVEHANPNPLPQVHVATARAASESVQAFNEVMGTVQALQEAQVSANIVGPIQRLIGAPGLKVRKGDVLAVIEGKEIAAAFDRAKASKESADRDLSRFTRLLSVGAVTQAEFDAVETQHQVATAAMNETAARMSRAIVKAPFNGTITRKFMDVGDLVSPGRPIFSIEDTSHLQLEIHVAESLAGGLELGQKVRVRVDVVKADLKATVVEVAPAANSRSRTFRVKLDLEPHLDLRSGQFGRAFLPGQTGRVIQVPAEAVFERGQMDYMFVVENGVAHLRIVRATEPRDSDGSTREILAGVDDGDIVVVSPPTELRDGQPVSASANGDIDAGRHGAS